VSPVIDHVIVLALENRSFDQMLGYLDHPSPEFDGLRGAGPYASRAWKGDTPVVATMDAKSALPIGPDHSHDGVIEQLQLTGLGKTRAPTNQGFVRNLERNCLGLAARTHEGILGSLVDLFGRLRKKPADPALAGYGVLAMACQSPDRVPVLSRLAQEFAVCTRWFSSVPGETWPNRNFMHAATSDGETNIEVRYYENRTIFELLSDNAKTWRIYYDDTPQVWAFHKVWDDERYHANWFTMDHFATHVREGSLPNYSFIEPNHRPPVHAVGDQPPIGGAGVSNNQHPENNLVPSDKYPTYTDTADSDFARGERLIASVYEALRGNQDLFERTLLVITYDEHGGFYDHVPPPTGVPSPGDAPTAWTRIIRWLYRRQAQHFDFTMLGVRVPAVLVSPFISPHTVDTAVRDHASIPATVRELFAPSADCLTARDRWSPPFHRVLNLDIPRKDDLPDLHEHLTAPVTAALAIEGGVSATPPAPPPAVAVVPTSEYPKYYKAFIAQSELVRQHLADLHEKEFERSVAPDVDDAGETVVERFALAAHRHRVEYPAPPDR
jgi:phospholipase C